MNNVSIPTCNDDEVKEYRFQRHNELMNLEEEYRITTLSPLIDLKVVPPQMNEGIKLIGCCGKGKQSSINIMKNEIQTNIITSLELPAKPIAIWPLVCCEQIEEEDDEDGSETDEEDKQNYKTIRRCKYIAMSFSNVTKILENKINDDEMNIEETQSTPILLSTPSILVSVMNDNTFIQVLSDKLIVYTEESIIEKRFSQCIKACCNGEDILLVVKENESSNETDTM